MEKRFNRLLCRLTLLGYRPFEIRSILRDTVGVEMLDLADDSRLGVAVGALEMYERLGSEFNRSYSK
ncbi:MAG: hypothetical protein P4N59_16665 [Negativicutes bacterium]|nr:hypothetical protein [Negativicutes bacterium]